MINNIILTDDEYEKVVFDLLSYIDKEIDIQFEYITAGECEELITIESNNPSTPSISLPARVYSLESYNYTVGIHIFVCEIDGNSKIVEIAVLPFTDESDKNFKKAIKYLKKILPNIPITNNLRNLEKNYEEGNY